MHAILLIICLLVVAGCRDADPLDDQTAKPEKLFVLAGQLEDKRIHEASGLAQSLLDSDVLWVINDRGSKERVHAIRANGARAGEFDLKKADNVDWEDLASFDDQGTPTLLVADIGDNDAKRQHRTLYFLTEPAPAEDAKAALNWKIDYRYPDGPRDAESAAVDVDRQEVLILSKRDLPPVLYSVPLKAETDDDPLVAQRLGAITSLPSPTQQEFDLAPKLQDWYWQPVGMDISTDNRTAVVLTYRAVYLYDRGDNQSWFEALNTKPQRYSIGNLKNAEAVAFGEDGQSVIVTGENRNSPIIRLELNGAPVR